MVSTSCNTTTTAPSSIGTFDALYGTLLTVLANARSDIGTDDYPEDFKYNDAGKFDFIIVGGGSSGCVLANRLSEVSNWNILLIEAGLDPPIESNIPSMYRKLMNTKYDWNYQTAWSKHSCQGMKSSRCFWSRGKMLGGSSSMNEMLYLRGNPFDYNGWAADGNDGWSYADLLPYFKKLENYTVDENDEQHHGHEGYLNIEPFREEILSYTSDIRNVLIQACEEIHLSTTYSDNYNDHYSFHNNHNRYGNDYHTEQTRLSFIADINGPNQKAGVTRVPGILRHGVRHNAARAYLSTVRGRSNLYVMKNATVTRVLMDDERPIVHGVQLYKDGRYWNISCTKEVIISAGAVNSPQLLMLSGIGPEKHLNKLGLELVADLPVGENLQDHIVFVGLMFTAIDSFLEPKNYAINSSDVLYNYLINKTDLNSLGVTDTMIFIDTTGHNDTYPNLQIRNYNFSPKSGALNDFLYGTFKIDQSEPSIVNLTDLNLNRELLLMAPTLLRPRSRGRITLESTDPFGNPIIETGYLTDRRDIDTLIKGIRFIEEKLENTKSMKNKFRAAYLKPDKCRTFSENDHEKYSDFDLECLIKHYTTTANHPVGTCKMGPTSWNSVVDPRLKVHGVGRLRVADASIMPNIVSGDTDIPCIMIGEKAADLIKMDWLSFSQREL